MFASGSAEYHQTWSPLHFASLLPLSQTWEKSGHSSTQAQGLDPQLLSPLLMPEPLLFAASWRCNSCWYRFSSTASVESCSKSCSLAPCPPHSQNGSNLSPPLRGASDSHLQSQLQTHPSMTPLPVTNWSCGPQFSVLGFCSYFYF